VSVLGTQWRSDLQTVVLVDIAEPWYLLQHPLPRTLLQYWLHLHL
jgi:hypothetical protein